MPQHPAIDTQPPARGGLHLGRLNWRVVSALVGIHAVALLAVFPALFSWSGLGMLVLFAWVSGGLGVTLCYHRLLTHRSFKTPKWLEYTLAICASLAWQGGPSEWVGMHRLHHKHSDEDHDPHSPKHGFTWAHMLWMLHGELEGLTARDAAKDLERDPIMRRIDRLFWLPQFFLAGGLLGIGWWIGGPMLGLSWVVWGVAVRTIVVFHATWFVNSATHTWGYRNYDNTGDESTNLWWVALLSFGEGWHNNHHAHPRSAAHGLRWFELDPTYWTIRVLGWLGLARDIKLPEPDKMPSAAPPLRVGQDPSAAAQRRGSASAAD